MCESSWLRPPDDRAGFHGCANLHVQFPQTSPPAFTDVRIFMCLPPGGNRRRLSATIPGYQESLRAPDDPAGFDRCANLHACLVQEPLRSPDDRAGFHGCANLHAYLHAIEIAGAHDARTSDAQFPRRPCRLSQLCESSCGDLLPLLLHASGRNLPAGPRTHDPCESRHAGLTRRIMVATSCKEPCCQYRRSSASIE